MGRSLLLLNKVMQMSVATIEESTLYALVPFTQYAFVSQVLFSHHIHALCLFGIRMCRQAFEVHLSFKYYHLKTYTKLPIYLFGYGQCFNFSISYHVIVCLFFFASISFLDRIRMLCRPQQESVTTIVLPVALK